MIGCSTSSRLIGSQLLCLGRNAWEMYSSLYLVSVVGGAIIWDLHKFYYLLRIYVYIMIIQGFYLLSKG